MVSYKLFIKKDAEKEIRSLPKADIKRVVKKILSLPNNPRPSGCEKLKGEEGYRIRQGVYRIVYSVDDNEKSIAIVKVGHRREVYR
jgi:mRNA interferase RelE/StbE